MGSMAQTGLLLVPSDALGHTWALPGVLGAGQDLPPESGPGNLKFFFGCVREVDPVDSCVLAFKFFLSESAGGERRLARGGFPYFEHASSDRREVA